MSSILVLHGPNLNPLGSREPSVYGHDTLESINQLLASLAVAAGHHVQTLQTNAEHELIERVQRTTAPDGRRLLVSTSYGGNTIPQENVVRAADFLLLHGNGVRDPKRIAEMVRLTRQVPGYRPMPSDRSRCSSTGYPRPRTRTTRSSPE